MCVKSDDFKQFAVDERERLNLKIESENNNKSLLPRGWQILADCGQSTLRVPLLPSTASFCEEHISQPAEGAVWRKSGAFLWEPCCYWFWPGGKFQWYLRVPKSENRVLVGTLPACGYDTPFGLCSRQFQCGNKWFIVPWKLVVAVVRSSEGTTPCSFKDLEWAWRVRTFTFSLLF